MIKNLPTVTIAAPVRNREWILNQYLEHIIRLDYPKNKIDIYFLLNDSVDDSQKILLEFRKKYKLEYNNIYIDTYNRKVPNDERTTKIRNNFTYTHLSILRNYIISKVKTDYLFSIDTDILIPSNSLQTLLSHNKKIISGLIYNGYIVSPLKPYKYTNIMKYDSDGVLRHISNYYIKNASSLTESKLLEVDVTGAFCLMHKDVIKSAKYDWHHQGEDVYFCKAVQENGYKIYCDLSVFASHIMIENKKLKGEENETKNTSLC